MAPAAEARFLGFLGEAGRAKKYPRKIRRNPLISLDSDERIQGNPRKSNPPEEGFRAEMGPVQDNPNRVDRNPIAACRRSRG
jgi:hypothetical protein